ncbi:hypothetical protein Nepgr_024180 [Nepenthes gracilis]|uniref:Uncharacterized protein n=1 Tax=Nepenthes gracilis TaxID=150966 RepID=A0AAD3T5F7_NEPGR|nr:hypothetical protein Nepgr_024180 [Nepenthes gracilis]
MLQCLSPPLRCIRQFSHVAAYSSVLCTEPAMTTLIGNKSVIEPNTPPNLEEPALIKLKKERDPEKLFELFKANAHNRLVVENKYAFEDTVSRLAGAGKYKYIEDLLEHQKSLPQGRREGFIVRIIILYGKAVSRLGSEEHIGLKHSVLFLTGYLGCWNRYRSHTRLINAMKIFQNAQVLMAVYWHKCQCSHLHGSSALCKQDQKIPLENPGVHIAEVNFKKSQVKVVGDIVAKKINER